jgi:hypothetical protein
MHGMICRCEGTASYNYGDVVSPRYHYGLEEPDCLARMPEEAPFPTPEVGKFMHRSVPLCTLQFDVDF